MGIFGRFEASKKECLGVLDKKKPKIWNSLLLRRPQWRDFSALGVAGSWHPNCHRLARWCAKVRRQGGRAAPLTGPCLGLLRMSSVALSQIHQASSEREMVTGAGCCTGASLGSKGEKWKRGDRRNPYGIPAFRGNVDISYPLFFLLPSVREKEKSLKPSALLNSRSFRKTQGSQGE